MFNFICKSFPRFKHSLTTSSTHKLRILQLNHLLSFSSKCEKEYSFSVKYLSDKCGFSPERALSASKYMNITNPDKPDAVIFFLKNQGFTETQVFKVIRSHPRVALSDPENTLLPKINFFLSQGVSKADLITTLAAAPDIFSTNLDRKVIPAFSCFKKLFGYSGDAIFTVKRCPRLITHFHNVVSNIETLRKVSVPEIRIKSFLKCWPRALSDPENTLLPKINFFLSQGVSKADLITTLAAAPDIFSTNLDRKVIPAFSCFKKLFGYSGDAIFTVKRCPRLITHFHNVVSNIETLRKVSVPEIRIKSFLKCWPRALTSPPIRFKQVVKEVNKMGVNPAKSTFFTAISAIFALSRFSWKKKMDLYKKWGCSEDKVLAEFVTNPRCMMVSEDKIDRIIGFFVNEFGWDPSRLMHNSKLLSYNLNRRIIPRCAVYKILLSKGFIKEDSSLYTLVCLSEEKFLKKYVECYKKEAPEVLKLYKEKMKPAV